MEAEALGQATQVEAVRLRVPIHAKPQIMAEPGSPWWAVELEELALVEAIHMREVSEAATSRPSSYLQGYIAPAIRPIGLS